MDDDEYGFCSWLDDARTASEVLDMVKEVGYEDAVKGLWDDFRAWRDALEEAMADDERHP